MSDAVADAGLDCTVLPDGATIIVDEATAREPDAAVQCGGLPDLDALTIDAPIIVVEVASPTSVRIDEDIKFVEYFSLPSIRHYLVVHPRRRVVVHHGRQESARSAPHPARRRRRAVPARVSVAVADLFGRRTDARGGA